MAGFSTAVTGIKATTTALDVTGNNIANASTVGFKSTRAEFADIYSSQVVGAGSQNVAGAGVLISDLAQDFSGGTTEFTNSNLDLAINGAGFFQLSDGQGGITYTRAGAFELDKDGFIVSKNGKNLRGYGLDSQGNQLPLKNLQVEERESPPHATENIGLSVNLQPSEDITTKSDYYSKTDPNSYAYTTTVETFDSLGNTQSIKFNYVEQKPQRETYAYQLTPTFPAAPANGDPSLPVTSQTAGVISISGVGIVWNAVGGGLFEPSATLPAAPATSAADALEAADPRIDMSTVQFDSNTGALTFKLKSEATGQGDMFVHTGAGTLETATNLDGQGRVELVAANEVLRVSLAPSDATNTNNTAFDTNGAGDDDSLRADTTIRIGGVDIRLSAGIDRDTAGQTIVDQYEDAIKENDPTIDSITYDSLTNELVFTWKAEAGDVYTDPSNPFEIVEDVANPGDQTTALFQLSAGAVQRTMVEGDNSYLGTYRLYAYLNDEQLLDVGKEIDPGEPVTGKSQDLQGDPSKYTEPGPVMLKFSSMTGLIESINGEDVRDQNDVPNLAIRGADQANPNDSELEGDLDGLRGLQLDISGSTRWESASIVKDQSQDGYSKGDLIGVSFDESGRMVASFSNGQRQELGIVAMATFESQSGLQPAGDTEWVPTLDSGQARLNPPGTGLNGSIRSAALEQSNVDLSAELVKLIEFQRNYQANSKTLETLNTVTQSILQI